MLHHVISETRLTVHCTDWRTDPHETERRHDYEAIQAKDELDIDSDRGDDGGENHVTRNSERRSPGDGSNGVGVCCCGSGMDITG